MSDTLPDRLGTPLVEIAGLSVVFGTGSREVTALDDIDLEIAPGSVVGLVGESGSGKSTLGNAILGLADVTAGTVRFDGEDITNADRHTRRRLARRIQAVFQDPFGSLNPTMTIGDILGEGLRYNQNLDRDAIDARLVAAVHDVGLSTATLGKRPSQFSGGQRQRIAIARALVTEPDFVVCDEVVTALDLSIQAQVLNLLRALARERGLAYLFISHDLDVVQYISDTIAVLYRGRIVEQGAASDVAVDPRHPYTRQLVAATLAPDVEEQRRRRTDRRSHRTSSDVSVRLSDRVGCVFEQRCGWATEQCRTERPELRVQDGRAAACWHSERIRVELSEVSSGSMSEDERRVR